MDKKVNTTTELTPDGKKDKKVELSNNEAGFRKEVTADASQNIMKAFFPIRIIAYVFGRFPFQTMKKPNGSIAFSFKKLGLAAIFFYITSVLFSIIFIMICVGFTAMFFQVNISKLQNQCSVTWELYNLAKTAVPTALTVSWLYLTCYGSIILLFQGKEYLNYMNYWNKAISVLQLDPTEGARRSAIIDNVQCLILIGLFVICYSSKLVLSLQDGAAAIANALVRLFIQDIGMSVEFNKVMSNASDCRVRKPGKFYSTLDYDSTSFTLWKLVGFVIQIYAFYGSLCLIIQFRFYCILLRNTASVWNERFQNALHGEKEDPTDQNKRRLSLKFLMKDHLIVVQMFKLTDAAFAKVLTSFFFVQILNLCCELYFLSAMRGMSSCDKLIVELKSDQQIIMKACLGMPATLDLNAQLETTKFEVQWFSDPCSSTQYKILQEAVVSLILLVQTLRITLSITLDASLAYEEAMRGFHILRKHCYMYCNSRRERNFMHSLIFSFASNHPIHITAGKYFVVNKALLLIMIGSIFTYYVILLQFQPGQFDTKDYCVEKVCKELDKFVKYGPELVKRCQPYLPNLENAT